MGHSNKDRYGKRHRSDSDHQIGESMPGDVGDSEGTFHDRARENSDVIVDGEVQSEESYQRSDVGTSKRQSSTGNDSQSGSHESISQSEAEGKIVEVEIESRGGTRDVLAHYKNHQIHVEGCDPGDTVRVRLQSGSGYIIGKLVAGKE